MSEIDPRISIIWPRGTADEIRNCMPFKITVFDCLTKGKSSLYCYGVGKKDSADGEKVGITCGAKVSGVKVEKSGCLFLGSLSERLRLDVVDPEKAACVLIRRNDQTP